MTYDVAGSLTTCDGPVPDTDCTDRTETVTDLDLTEVSRTEDTITHRAAAAPQADGRPSMRDTDAGTLELRLD